MVPPGSFVRVFILAIALPALAHLGRVLVGVQPPLQLLDTALLAGRGVTFALLLAQRVEFLLQGIVTRPRRIVRVVHGGALLVDEPGVLP